MHTPHILKSSWPPLTVRRAISYPASRVASIFPRLVRKEDNRRRLCSQGRPHWKTGDCEQSTLGAAGIDWWIKLHACTCSEPPTERKKHRAWSLWSIGNISVYEILNPSYIFYFTPVLLYSISLSFVHSSKHQCTHFLGMDQIEQLLSTGTMHESYDDQTTILLRWRLKQEYQHLQWSYFQQVTLLWRNIWIGFSFHRSTRHFDFDIFINEPAFN